MTEPESIRTVATVTLALDELGPQTIDRLAELVAGRLIEQRAAGAEPLLNTSEAAKAAGVHPETVRRRSRPVRCERSATSATVRGCAASMSTSGWPVAHRGSTRSSRTGSYGGGRLVCVDQVRTRGGWVRRCRR
jgi:hypothetical protein